MFINRGVMPSRPSELVTRAHHFLHHVNINNDAALFFPTETAHLRYASFVDGRTPLATGPAEVIPISETPDLLPPRAPEARYLFNMSFCGSTFIARLLDVAGTTLVLKEPKAFNDLAAWKTLQLRGRREIGELGDSLRLVRHAMFRQHVPGEKVVVKPACWVNNIIPELIGDDRCARAVFVTIDRLGFLNAVFRGGSERIEHTARLAWHMATVADEGDELIDAAGAAAKGDETQRSANLVMVAHALQARVFEAARARIRWNSANCIDFKDLVTAPFEVSSQASLVLDLGNDPEALRGNVRLLRQSHAKAPNLPFSLELQAERDRKRLAPFTTVFGRAIDWAEQTFGEPKLGPALDEMDLPPAPSLLTDRTVAQHGKMPAEHVQRV